jgi:hypothetical protein
MTDRLTLSEKAARHSNYFNYGAAEKLLKMQDRPGEVRDEIRGRLEWAYKCGYRKAKAEAKKSA